MADQVQREAVPAVLVRDTVQRGGGARRGQLLQPVSLHQPKYLHRRVGVQSQYL